MLQEAIFFLPVKQVPCETKRYPEGHGAGICVDLNGDGTPDDSFCARNGSTSNNHSLHHGSSDTGERMSISYSHNWPALDVILEKGSEINGLMGIGTRSSGAWDDSCRRPMGKRNSVYSTKIHCPTLHFLLASSRPNARKTSDSPVAGVSSLHCGTFPSSPK